MGLTLILASYVRIRAERMWQGNKNQTPWIGHLKLLDK